MKFRRLNHWYADLMGYFWLPCPLCGQEFGGHEWRSDLRHDIPTDRPHVGKGVCPDCGPLTVMNRDLLWLL